MSVTATAGKLIGVGVGPGDPELMTVKAARALRDADVIAYFAKAGNPSHSRATIAQYLRAGVIELPLAYPVTTELPKCSAGYRDAIGMEMSPKTDPMTAFKAIRRVDAEARTLKAIA